MKYVMMARRIITAREQHAMLSPWRMAALDHDLTTRLDEEFHPRIFDKRQQMQRAYEQRQTTASFLSGPLSPDSYHWDLDWSQASESSLPLSELQHRQYPDTRRPQGRFNVQNMPPVKVLFHNDLHWIMDGHHRAQWAARNGITHIPALILNSQND